MIKVLQLIQYLSPGGAARAMLTVAKYSSRFDNNIIHRVASYFPNPPDAGMVQLALNNGMTVVHTPGGDTLLKEIEQADIIHINWWNNPELNDFLHRELPPMRLLLWYHVGGDHAPQVITRQLIDLADFAVACSPYTYERPVFQNLSKDERQAKVRMVLAPADFERLSGFQPKPHNTFNIGYIGTVDFVKMHPNYVSMSAAVDIPQARFIICGGGSAIPILQQQARQLGKIDHFDIRGYVNDIRPVIEVLDLYGYPLCEENYAAAELNLQEVMYAGIPAIVFPYGGVSKLVVHNETGLIVRSEREYSEALEYLYYTPTERIRLGCNAAEYARQHFGAENAVWKFNDLYTQMMRFPKHQRIWKYSEGIEIFNQDAFVTGPTQPQPSGAELFAESLGEAGKDFFTSLHSKNIDELLVAEDAIGKASPLLRSVYSGGIWHYRSYYPKDGYLRLWSGLVLKHLGNYTDALSDLASAINLGCNHWRVGWYMAQAAEKSGKSILAKEIAQTVLKAVSNFGPAKEMLGLVNPISPLLDIRKPRTTSAIEVLNAILEADDILKALEQYEDKLDEDLLGLVNRNIETARQNGESELIEGLKNLAGYIEDAIARRKKAAPLDQELSGTISTEQPAAEVLKNLLKSDNMIAAVQETKMFSVTSKVPALPVFSNFNIAQDYPYLGEWTEKTIGLIKQADQHLGEGDVVSAQDALSQAINFLPHDPWMIVNLGNLKLQQGDIESARREFVKATILTPDFALAHSMLGLVLIHQERYDEAEIALKRALNLNPADDNAKGLLAGIKTEIVKTKKHPYLVTAIVSTYNSEEFMRECLTDLVNQTIAEQVEIIVIDASSTQKERSIVEEFQQKYKNITYVRTGERIGVYAAWNMAIKFASGKYITPFSTNDRLRKDAYEILARALDDHPDAALVYGNTYITSTPHETFEHHTRTGAMVWPDYSFEDLLEYNRVGPHPMWRKELHADIGYLSEEFVALGDQEFWLRIGEKYKLLHIPVFTGLYWHTEQALSGNGEVAGREYLQARKPYRERYRGEKYSLWERARVQVNQAKKLAEQNNIQAAEKLSRNAVEIAPDFAPALITHGQILAVKGDFAQAIEYLKRGIKATPDDFLARLICVQVLIKLNQPERAMAELTAIKEILPDLPQVKEYEAQLKPYIKSVPPIEVERSQSKPVSLQPKFAPEKAEDAARLEEIYHQELERVPTPLSEKTVAHSAEAMDWKVDIVVPVYGQPQFVRQCVESVLATTENAHLILVDDNSPGNEISRLFQRWQGHDRITLARTPNNQGLIGSTRLGASLGKAPYILFLNSNTEALEPGWLEKLLPPEDDIAIVGAKLLHPPSTPGPMAGKIQHAGVARDDNGLPYHPFLGWDANAPQPNQPREVNAITGACFLVRRQIWDELGGWDARFGHGVYEDVDLCWQARQKGYRVLYQPAASLYYYSGASEVVGGRHLLYGQNKTDNLEKLLAKWQGVKSDEDIFFGKETIQRWQRARKQINQAAGLLDKHQFNQAMNLIKKTVKTTPDLPEVLIGYAQLLAAQGKHRQAAEQIVKALEATPAHWDARLRLVDEWIAADNLEKAAEEFIHLQTVFPNDASIQQRAAKLAGYLKKTAQVKPTPTTTPVPPTTTPVPPPTPTAPPKAAQTLERLLNADDLPTALKESETLLDDELLALVRGNAVSARADGNCELADGLEDLASYVAEVIAARPTSPQSAKTSPAAPEQLPAAPRPAETLRMLLEADDLAVALKEHEDKLDTSLLDLVRRNAETANTDGNTDLAEGLDNLAEIIAEVIEQRKETSPKQVYPQAVDDQTLGVVLKRAQKQKSTKRRTRTKKNSRKT